MNNIQFDQELFNQTTPREREIIADMAADMRLREIARKRGITLNTAEVHRHNILKKTGIKTTHGLVAACIRGGII
jgi:DNA-binding CsgD family transcriptional regulator